VRKSYVGVVLPREMAGKDDGSSPQEMELEEEEVSLYISQEEWASGGLTISQGQVQCGRWEEGIS
jgi:hypothetical protein